MWIHSRFGPSRLIVRLCRVEHVRWNSCLRQGNILSNGQFTKIENSKVNMELKKSHKILIWIYFFYILGVTPFQSLPKTSESVQSVINENLNTSSQGNLKEDLYFKDLNLRTEYSHVYYQTLEVPINANEISIDVFQNIQVSVQRCN